MSLVVISLPMELETQSDDFMTVREVADYLKVTAQAVYLAIKKSGLKVNKGVGPRSYRIRRADLELWLRKRDKEAQ